MRRGRPERLGLAGWRGVDPDAGGDGVVVGLWHAGNATHARIVFDAECRHPSLCRWLDNATPRKQRTN
eukprot:3756933-Pyramimonas_sp.AAC.1